MKAKFGALALPLPDNENLSGASLPFKNNLLV